ncbi:hypothetical protein [Cryobacterium roopkundense]|uniref:Uncharacterized protein n=1 Tax=Cryobacterium roopkundense TaxID=1001240 RepID=A0A7W8ZTI9_9MICO|nr:hypothetical protein [Cryobacterium roopkundense]MBB5639793.1 hypothetical protein [Cryobacterium roopkundense]
MRGARLFPGWGAVLPWRIQENHAGLAWLPPELRQVASAAEDLLI